MNQLLTLVYLTLMATCSNILGQDNTHTYTLRDTVKAITYYDSAGIYFKKADHRNAKKNYLEALTIYKNLFGDKGHKRIANIYLKIAKLELGAFNNTLALDYINKSLEIYMKLCGEISKETASSLGSLGIVYDRLEMPDKAEYFYNIAYKIYAQLLGENNNSVAACYNNLGNIYKSKNDYDKAAEYQNKALNIRLKVHPSNPEDIAASYNNLADIFYCKGDYDLALEYEKRGLIIKQTIFDENHPAIGWSYNNIGSNYFSKDDYEKALLFHRKALNIFIKTSDINPPDLGITYGNIGNVYKMMRKYDSALFYQKKALEVNLKFSDTNHHNIASIYNDLGDTYYKNHQYDSALVNFSKALDAEKNILYKPHPQIAEYQNNLAESYLANNLVGKANDCLDSAFAYNQSGCNVLSMPDSIWLNNTIDHKIMMRTLLGKVDILTHFNDISQEKLQKALICAKEALFEAEKAIFEITSENSKLNMGEDIYMICDNAIKILYKLYNQTHDNYFIADAFYFTEKSKSSVLFESLAKPKVLLQAGIPEQIIQKERSFRSNISYYETKRKTTAISQTPFKENTDSILFSLKSQYKEFLDSINTKYPRLSGLLKEAEIININDIQKRLLKSSAIIEYFTGKENTYALIITPEKQIFVELPSDTSLASRIKIFLTGIRKNNQEVTYKNGTWLYNSLFEPLVPMLKGVDKLLIIPDQALSTIPFETIITGGSCGKPSYLIEKYAITYQLSASIWLDKTKSIVSGQQSKIDLIDFAGFAPVFNNDSLYAVATQRDGFADKYGSDTTFFEQLRSQQYFRELPNSGEEVTQISSLFKKANQKADVYMYGQATKSAFKNYGPRYNILHIATHAFANNNEPELSWLAFANIDSTKTNNQNDDGILYAGEIYGLTLNSSLIVLSACETGVGKVVKGEGIMSLSRSLMFAGASNIILSLWKVGDLDSKLLMIEFYKAYLSGKSYADALRTAKLSILKKNPNPKSWAGFVLFGI